MNYKAIILRKMFRGRLIGGKHTAIEHITRGIPRDNVGKARRVVKELVKEGLIHAKRTPY